LNPIFERLNWFRQFDNSLFFMGGGGKSY
jgi:hypothetical protein